ncbi:MAG: ParB/RepB/Spo0J family partition protein [Bacilli bacterium]|nr:ParB/RepB/Spo0J family partition protein [Bacilli bacterium]
MENKKRALGRGLEQLFDNESIDLNSFEQSVYESINKEEIVDVDVNELRPNPYQPRRVFDDEALDDLTASIREHGIFQPIIVKRSIKGYEIIAGERRVRAAKKAGLDKVPAIIRDLDDGQMMEIALLENLQRENLNAIEEALAYKAMLEKFAITQDELSEKVGKSRSHVTNTLGLLRLPAEVQEMVANNSLSMGHARVLSKLEDNDKIIALAHEIVDNKLPVRDIERKATVEEKKVKINKPVKERDKEYIYAEELLREKLDTRVRIQDNKIVISFTNTADLNRILDTINLGD